MEGFIKLRKSTVSDVLFNLAVTYLKALECMGFISGLVI